MNMIGYGIVVSLADAVSCVAKSRNVSEKEYMRSLISNLTEYRESEFEQDYVAVWTRLEGYLKYLISTINYAGGKFVVQISTDEGRVFVGLALKIQRAHSLQALLESLERSLVRKKLVELGFSAYEPEEYITEGFNGINVDGVPLSNRKQKLL
jgi:hypothetical protein